LPNFILNCMKLSVSEENYLKQIYLLQQEHGSVSTNTLAKELKTKPASVSDMLRKLKDKKLVHYEPYKAFVLSEKGNKTALHIVRRHRLWECFLAEKLGFEWDEVHDIAEELEHVSSDSLISRLATFLGDPRFDPHGDPIPDSNGKMTKLKQVAITTLPLHTTKVVCGVSDQSTAMLELLNHYGIGIGTTIQVVRYFDFDGSLELRIGKKHQVLSHVVAKNIFVPYER
jgi:DtxR family transcriptional regulator, Mn-dependent transcriptional regulator